MPGAPAGERLVAPLRAAAPAIIDALGEMPFTGMAAIHADPVDPVPVYDRGGLLRDFPQEAADALIAAASGSQGANRWPAPFRIRAGRVIWIHPIPVACRPPSVPYGVLAHDAVRMLTVQGRDARPLADGMLEWRVAELPVAIGAAA
jgi:hypothetical protein